MKKLCSCYETKRYEDIVGYKVTGEPVYGDVIKCYCNGTKERDMCLCQGDRASCDFYENIRKEAQKSDVISSLSDRLDRAIKNLCSGDENAVPELLAIKHILEKMEV